MKKLSKLRLTHQPILLIKINAMIIPRYEADKGKRTQTLKVPALSVAFVGSTKSTIEPIDIENGLADQEPPDPNYIPGIPPGEVFWTINPRQGDGYEFLGSMLLFEPESKNSDGDVEQEQLEVGQTFTIWSDMKKLESEILYRKILFDENLYYNHDFQHGNVLIEANDEQYLEYIGTPGWLEFTQYMESYTTKAATTCTFNHYPELKESMKQKGDVGIYVSPREGDESIDMSVTQDQYQQIGTDGDATNKVYREFGSIPAQHGSVVDGWYVVLYQGWTRTSMVDNSATPTLIIGQGELLNNICVTLGLGILVADLEVYHTISSTQYGTIGDPYVPNNYVMKAVTFIQPHTGKVVHYDGLDDDVAGAICSYTDTTDITDGHGARTLELIGKPSDVMGEFEPTFTKQIPFDTIFETNL